jgi:hypothetical protein
LSFLFLLGSEVLEVGSWELEGEDKTRRKKGRGRGIIMQKQKGIGQQLRESP